MATPIVKEEEILAALRQLEPVQWSQVLQYIDQLQNQQRLDIGEETTENPSPLTAKQLLESGLVGIWADREEIKDSPTFARHLREQAGQRRTDHAAS